MRGPRTLTTLLLVASAVGAEGRAQDPAARAEWFEARVRPVLVERCYACHNSAERARGGLALDHRAATRAASPSGTAVVPGDPQRSLLLQVVRHELEGLEMPDGGPRLEPQVIADLERWILEGAFDPRDAPPGLDELDALTSWEATLARRTQWWSLRPIRRVEPPPASAWSDHPVDRFVERELRRRGLEPGAAADRRTLIRRLSHVLTGLPPTPEEVAAFLADGAADATERLVERLLASPRYGERWARHWMDLVRYADSHGSEGDPAIPGAYRYRDYLIRAFNQDVPYDQLVREHVAGDLLAEPRVDAQLGVDESAIGAAHWRLVFHGFAPTDALAEKVRFVDDQINVFGKAFLAQTISCARCHDHKFDAISQADYYALFGILASCRPGMQDVNVEALQTRHRAELAALKRELRSALAAAWRAADGALAAGLRARSEQAAQAVAPVASAAPPAPVRRWDLSSAAGLRTWYRWGNGLVDAPAPAGAFALEAEGERVLTGIYPAGVYTHLVSTRHRGVLASARFALDGAYEVWFQALGAGGAKLRYVVQDYPRSGTVHPVTAIEAGAWTWHRLDLSYWASDSVHLELHTAQDAPVEVGGGERSWFGLREVLLLEPGAGPPAPPADPLARALAEPPERAARRVRDAIEAFGRADCTDEQALLLDACLRAGLLPNQLDELPAVAPLVARYRALEARVPLPTRVPGLLEADAADRPLFVRGDPRRPGEVVPRRFLEAIDPAPYRSAASGRLELADSLLDARNPLTARVIVNRLWHHLFGRGLVATPDDFGRMGAEPSHPELLDHLATRMVERGWSIKDMLRFLVSSKTWQLDSRPSPRALAEDPENVWLSHARVRRLDAEAVRDALFAVAGRLDERMYGPGFPANSATPRRSVYVQVRRNDLDAFLQAFDAPVPFATTGARYATNVPAQSLALLNGPLAWELARQWGAAAAADRRHGSDGARLASMFEALTGRPPTAAEREALEDSLRRCRAELRDARERRVALERGLARDEAALEALLAPVRERLLGAPDPGAAARGPAPIARWDFRAGLEDTVGELHGTAHGTARLAAGGLLLDGAGYVSTPAIGRPLGAKTLEVWVQLENLDQRGGGAMSVQDLRGEVFDSIVYGERVPRRWMAGSDFFRRTADFGGPDEDRALAEPVHVAIAWDEDGRVRAYRDGEPYGTAYRKAARAGFAAGAAQVLFGLRHGLDASGGRTFEGVVFEARLHDRALSAEELAASAAGGAFVSRARVLAALGAEERRRAAELEAAVAAARAELQEQGEPLGESEAWTRVAHALFNLKELLYLR